MPSHISLVEPLGPEWPSCRQIFACDRACTKSTMRFHASTCSGRYIPVQPGEMRPSRVTHVISVNTSPAPPSARVPRWTRWKSLGVPSAALYMSIGETTTRLASSRSRRRNGANIGGAERPPNHRSTEST